MKMEIFRRLMMLESLLMLPFSASKADKSVSAGILRLVDCKKNITCLVWNAVLR